jgi:hypothetical protein
MAKLSEKQNYMKDFVLKYGNSIEAVFTTFGQKWFYFNRFFKLLRKLLISFKKNRFIDIFFILEKIETPIRSPLIIDLTWKFENIKEKGRSYSNSINAKFEHAQDKYSFFEVFNASSLEEKEGFIVNGNITVPLTLFWINVYFQK